MVKLLIKAVLILTGAVAALLVLVLMILSVSEYRPQPEEQIALTGEDVHKTVRDGDEITMLTFNIGYGGLDKDMDFFMDGGRRNTPESKEKVEENLTGIAEIVAEQDADVIFLQEVDRDSKRSYHINEADMLAEALGGVQMFAQNYRCLYVPWPLSDAVGQVNSGLMTLSGLEVRDAGRIALPVSFCWPVRLCQLKRCLLVTRIPVEGSGRELVLFNLHLEAYDGQEKQTEVLFELMKQEYEKGNYVVAAGDFNQVFPEDDFTAYPLKSSRYYEPGRLEKDMLTEGWTFASDISTPTCRLLNEAYHPHRSWSTQYYVIDGYILSPNVTLQEVSTLGAGFEYADHNPVRISVRLDG